MFKSLINLMSRYLHVEKEETILKKSMVVKNIFNAPIVRE